MRANLIGALLLTCSLMACSSTAGSTFTQVPGSQALVEKINGVVVPPDPGSAKDSTPEGVDTDKNGIRDEIDRMLATKYGTKPELLQAMQMTYAALQSTINAKPITKDDALSVVYRNLDSGSCAARVIRKHGLPVIDSFNESFAITVNTRSRLDARKKLFDLSGMIMRNIKDNTISCPYIDDLNRDQK